MLLIYLLDDQADEAIVNAALHNLKSVHHLLRFAWPRPRNRVRHEQEGCDGRRESGVIRVCNIERKKMFQPLRFRLATWAFLRQLSQLDQHGLVHPFCVVARIAGQVRRRFGVPPARQWWQRGG